MYIFKIFMNYAKEEKWLDEMAKSGYSLTNASPLGYRFVKVNPEDATYKIDFRTFKSTSDFIDYCTMFEDSGWKHIVGTKSCGNQYFKKISGTSVDDIFSDNLSKANRYSRSSKVWLAVATTYLASFFVITSTSIYGLNDILNPKHLYLTPGLWEKSGSDFIGSFLFETPFALMRGLPLILFPIMIFLFAFFTYKSRKLYKETLK